MLYPDSKLWWENPLKSNSCISQNQEPAYASHESRPRKEPVQRCAASPSAWGMALGSWPLPTQCPRSICPPHPQLMATLFFSSSRQNPELFLHSSLALLSHSALAILWGQSTSEVPPLLTVSPATTLNQATAICNLEGLNRFSLCFWLCPAFRLPPN